MGRGSVKDPESNIPDPTKMVAKTKEGDKVKDFRKSDAGAYSTVRYLLFMK